MGKIPPDQDDPGYQGWLDASARQLKAREKLDRMSLVPESDPEFAAAYAEWTDAKKAYDDILALIDAGTG